MGDFNGNTLKCGDKVAFVSAYSRCLEYGEVVGFTPQNIRIVSLHSGHPIIRGPEQVAKL